MPFIKSGENVNFLSIRTISPIPIMIRSFSSLAKRWTWIDQNIIFVAVAADLNVLGSFLNVQQLQR